MFKPKSLRNALTDAVPVLKQNPEMLRVFLDSGNSPLRLRPRCSSKTGTRLILS